MSDIKLESAERVAREITGSGGTASIIQQDTARPEDNQRVVDHALSSFGALHYAVNNLASVGPRPAGEVGLADWQRVIAINLNGVLYGMRYQIPAMLKAGAAKCAIVNMAGGQAPDFCIVRRPSEVR